jgi:aspartyl aminopeptidase
MAKVTAKEAKKAWDKLAVKPVLAWDKLDAAGEKAVFDLAEEYKKFLDQARTERLAVDWAVAVAKAAGFKAPGPRVKRLLLEHRGKALALAWLGQRPVEEGLRLIGAHIDCPRLDFKSNPVYEEAEVVFLKSQYYGGIKKYQWLARPLALVGVVYKSDGSRVDLRVGLEPGDPVFTVADLLPHLAAKVQYDKKLTEAFPGEKLNLLAGSRPVNNPEVKERFKLALLQLLHDRYGLTEADFVSAELEAVPAEPARDVGFDRALVGGYGHDDRVSSFQALQAALRVKDPVRPGLCLLVDKEEIGSEGNTGAKSRFLEMAVARLLAAAGRTPSAQLVQETLFRTKALSADVAPAFDPDYPEVHEKRNAAFLGHGPAVVKYTGVRGKYSASDANAEYLAWLRRVLDQAQVVWQAGGLGKVDEGGGGTIAMFLADHGMEVVDFGIPVLGMHSPFELISKVDLHMGLLAMAAFYAAD